MRRIGRRAGTYGSLQIRITGRVRGGGVALGRGWPVFVFSSLPPDDLFVLVLRGAFAISTNAATGPRPSPCDSTPSNSSSIIQLGLLLPKTELISIALRIRSVSTGAVRSSLALTSTGLYPRCRQATCASVVFPAPGGPHNMITRVSGQSSRLRPNTKPFQDVSHRMTSRFVRSLLTRSTKRRGAYLSTRSVALSSWGAIKCAAGLARCSSWDLSASKCFSKLRSSSS
mmetsp:Transcript_6232/g.11077  ORF Transcript_6232/g.11077 Transcript_6232/m.11077 type:complete len:228 (-) Transcript_6232:836-1519(-)